MKILPTHRWTRIRDIQGNYDWTEIECFRFEDDDGTVSYADHLSPTQADMLQAQELDAIIPYPDAGPALASHGAAE